MSPDFQELTQDEALDFVDRNAAFTGMFARRVKMYINAPGDSAPPKILVTILPPVKLHLFEVGPFRRRTRLNFRFTPRSDATVLFGDWLWIGGSPDFEPNRSCRLEALTQLAVVLVVEKDQPGADLEVTSYSSGETINFEYVGNGAKQKQIFIWLFKVIDPAKMVGWYDPGQLARTGVEVFISTVFGRHSDYRLMEALTTVDAEEPPNGFYDFTRHWKPDRDTRRRDKLDERGQERSEIWIDYVGDVGDGWNSTYAVAHCLAQPTLQVRDAHGETHPTKRGDILLFGGDQVYPIADRKNYAQRLLGPYETALDETRSPHPHAFAIPGNHDWYDSLVSFTRLFCQRRWFGGWQTDQSRSYFALKLPHNWWILGTDVQLDSDIDVPQVNFFKKVAESIQSGDRVIICTAEPHWVYAALYGKDDTNYNENNLAFLQTKVIAKDDPTIRILAFIAGDQHHYRRYKDPGEVHKITAGGGGAFLHPTHGEVADKLPEGFKLENSFPATDQSRRLCLKNFLFLLFNPSFGVLTAALYLLTAWSVMEDLSVFGISQWPQALKASVKAAMLNPFAVFWILAVFGGFWLFTDTHSRAYRWIAGTLHGLAHLTAVFLIGWFATYLSVYYQPPFQSFWQLILVFVLIVGLGWIVGSTIMGVYLYVSLNWFGRHSNEAFSSLKIQGWKNFLRMKIDSDGTLWIYPIGLKTVPTKWKHWKRRTGPARRPDQSRHSDYEPRDGPLEPTLIEGPISLP